MVGIHLARVVSVRRNLPARQVDGLQPGLHLLHRLVAGQRTQRVDERRGGKQAPQFFGAAVGQGMFYDQGSAQSKYILGRIAALDVAPARVLFPVFLDRLDLGGVPARFLAHVNLLGC